jgi:hypothetical protein
MKKGIMDLLVEELNNNRTEAQKEEGEKWERLHSEQYQIVQTENGVFRNKKGR